MKHTLKQILLGKPFNKLDILNRLLNFSAMIRSKLPYDHRKDSAYKFMKTLQIPSTAPVNVKKSTIDKPRITLLIPTVNRAQAFGGISTALDFFQEVSRQFGNAYQYRIVTLNFPLSNDLMVDSSIFNKCNMDDESAFKYQLTSACDRKGKSLVVRKEEYFVATSWWSAYLGFQILEEQSTIFNINKKKLVYLIQDYEPGFYAWSSNYALADSTYMKRDFTKAVFNTAILKDFFLLSGYKFNECYTLDPSMNSSLRVHRKKNTVKQRKLIIYGRPSVPRNLFELLVLGIIKWSKNNTLSKKWEIISLGESFPDIHTGSGKVIRSMGKVTLDQYAEHLNNSAVGISLMLSPHPSYPPFEMAHFGILTLTNCYQNKDLSKLHSNIYSVTDLSPESIASSLHRITLEFESNPEKGWQADDCAWFGPNENEYRFVSKLFP